MQGFVGQWILASIRERQILWSFFAMTAILFLLPMAVVGVTKVFGKITPIIRKLTQFEARVAGVLKGEGRVLVAEGDEAVRVLLGMPTGSQKTPAADFLALLEDGTFAITEGKEIVGKAGQADALKAIEQINNTIRNLPPEAKVSVCEIAVTAGGTFKGVYDVNAAGELAALPLLAKVISEEARVKKPAAGP
ncbi:MAG: hypothetical protein ACJ8FY_18620 [Gemmataceae bacterium]